MTKLTLINTDELPFLSDVITTSWMQKIETQNEDWHLYDIASSKYIRFEKLKNEQLKYFFKLFYSNKMQSKSLSLCHNSSKYLFNVFSKIDRKINEKIIISIILDEFKLRNGTKDEHLLWYIKDWYLWCTDMSLPFFCEDFCLSLSNIKISGNLKGQAVLSLNEEEGPLKEIELNQFINLLQKDNSIDLLQSRLMCWLFLTLGCNTRNLSLLKVRDLKKIGDNESGYVYFLNVPRIKKRIIGGTEYKTREIDQRIGKLLEDYIASLKLPASSHLFLSKNLIPLTGDSIGHKVTEYAVRISDPNFKVHISPRRLRYTFATRLVMSGVSKERLADLLDHSDLQNIQVYYDLRHKIKGYLTEAESQKLTDVFGRFEGSIISKSKSLNGEDLKFYSKNRDPLVIGKCGSSSLCDLSPPYSCFVCPKFNAFEDSLDTYKEMLSTLEKWKEKREEEFDANDRIQYLMDEVLVSLNDLINRITKKYDNEK